MGTAATPEGTSDPGPDAGGTAGDAGAEGAPKPGEGGEAGEAGGAGEQSLADYRADMHPVLRDMNPKQITELFETMSAGMRTAPAPEAPKVAEPPKAPEAAMMDPSSEEYDPRKFIEETVQRSFGGVVSDLQKNAMSGVFGELRSKFPDFKKYEDRIQAEVAKVPAGTTVTSQQLARAYFELKGLDQYNADKAATAKAASVKTERPSPPKEPDKEVPLSEQERAVAPKMFPRAKGQEAAEAEYKKYATAKIMEEGVMMDVPTGGGKSE